MAVNKLDPKIIFASEAPTQDTPAVFNNRTLGWGESRKNGGRPTIKQMNALQQDTELKILWLNENAVTPFDATIDYPVNAVTIKDGKFKIFNGTSWNLFLDKSSVGLNNVDNTSDLNKPISTAVKTKLDYIDNNGAALPYKDDIAYEENAVVVKDGVLQQWKGGSWVSVVKADHNDLTGRDVTGAHPASAILDESGKSQQEINDALIKNISSPSEISDFKPNVDDIFYIAEKEAYFKTELGVADNILSFPAGTGKRAKLMHNGEIQYKNVGSTAANLMYAVNTDLSIKKVIGDELVIDNIVRINRGNLELEFNKSTYPETISGGNNALSSLIEFKGVITDENLDQYILVADLPEFSEQFPVSNITKFNVGDWVIISNGTSPQKINYMCRVLELNIDKIKVDYRLGWALIAGDTLSFKKVDPISNVKIKVKEWNYLPTDTRETARAGVLLQYAHDCKVEGTEFENTFWPCVVGRHTHSCGVIDNKLNNPQSTQTGGDGYLVQWSASLYMKTEDNITHNDRHLHDITMGAYASIRNNRSINSKDGGFVTHGQYEHDLYYENNVGVLSFANSGSIFGQRAKRLTVNKHNAQAILASAGVVDLTLTDVVCQNHASLNVDGLQATNLQVYGGISFSNGLPTLSKRQNLLIGGYIKHLAAMSFSTASMSSILELQNVNIDDFTQATINGTGTLFLNECHCNGNPTGNSNLVAISNFKIKGGSYKDVGFRWFTATDQSVTIDSPVVSGIPTSGTEFIGNRKTGGNAIIKIINMDSDLTSGFHYSVTQSVGSCQLDVNGGKYVGGSVRYQQATADLAGSYLYIRGTTEESVIRTVPTASTKVKFGDCLILA